jgi:hypothetical protein
LHNLPANQSIAADEIIIEDESLLDSIKSFDSHIKREELETLYNMTRDHRLLILSWMREVRLLLYT